MKQAFGRITVVQEQRFRLRTDSGQSYLFTLANNAAADAPLQELHREAVHVVVDFEGEPGLASGVARGVRRA